MEKSKLFLIGGGGHCQSVIESIERTNSFIIEGISDVASKIGEYVLDYKISATDETIQHLGINDLLFLITIGQIKTAEPRKKAYNFLKSNNQQLATIIDPGSIVSKRAIIGEGTVILRNSFINAGVEIGVNCIVNTGAIIEHDSKIGRHVHISTGAIVNGDCVIGDESFIGSGAVISNGITIVAGTLVGAGTVVLQNINEPGTYLGNPAKRIK